MSRSHTDSFLSFIRASKLYRSEAYGNARAIFVSFVWSGRLKCSHRRISEFHPVLFDSIHPINRQFNNLSRSQFRQLDLARTRSRRFVARIPGTGYIGQGRRKLLHLTYCVHWMMNHAKICNFHDGHLDLDQQAKNVMSKIFELQFEKNEMRQIRCQSKVASWMPRD